jgi:phosphate transport system substrate-binding protein
VLLLVALTSLVAATAIAGQAPASAETYKRISGAGSSWSANALDQWISDVDQFGMRVDYASTGSSDGRHQFLTGTVDFAASDIPFQTRPEDGSAPEQPTNFAYMPITAGGTVFMYNLSINGQRVTNLRLSGENVAKLFTGVITKWNDPALQAENPGLALPDRAVVPVVRSDGSGSTAQFTLWLISRHKAIWDDYCRRSGRAPACGSTSYYPTIQSMVAQNGDLGVAGYVAQSYAAGAIGYVNYSYALNGKFPVVKLLNDAGYYTEPTPSNVAVSLLKAEVDTSDPSNPSTYLTQKLEGVYANADPRAYPLSSYSYLILPTKVAGQFTTDKGKTLAAFAAYAMCEGQQESADLGYSPMPINLVQASFDQIKKVPGAVIQGLDIAKCNNPTFSPDGHNRLADEAPQPADCDRQGQAQCTAGTGGARQETARTGNGIVVTVGGGGGGGGGSGGGGSGAGSGSAAGAGSGTGGAAAAPTAAGGGGGTGTGTGASKAACDVSSGACASASGQTASAAGPSVVTATLAASAGWTTTQTLMGLIALLLLGLLVAPSLVARRHERASA